MKFLRNRKRSVEGSVLLVTIVICILLGLTLASYLTLAESQKLCLARSQSWNASLAAAEAGVEEAMAQLNPAALLLTTNINPGANGWTSSGNLYLAPRRTLLGGYYDVAITSDALPTIYATGYVTVPIFSDPVRRTIRVKTGMASLFKGAMAARVDADFKGFGVTVDSFDSLDPNYSTAGRYDVTKRKAGGDVASTAGVINVQNAKVMGTLYTGPTGSYNVGASGSVGDIPWVTGGSKGLEPGHYKNDFNADFPDVLPPYDPSTAVAPASKTISGVTYFWVLGNGNYSSSGATLKTGDTILVTGSKARLYVTGDFNMQGSSTIIMAAGASLELYVAGANCTITTVNNTGNASTFNYYGLPSNTSFSLTGNASFLGSVYAPSATFTLGGGGSDVYDFEGAVAVNTIKMNGHFNFHFDENLKKKGPVRGFSVGSWDEI